MFRKESEMIIDSIKNWKSYDGILPYYREAVEFAMTLKDKPAGRYECGSLPEGAVFAMVQEGEHRPLAGAKAEAHRRYADMQIMLEGGETVGYIDIAGLEEAVPFDEEKDSLLPDSLRPVPLPHALFNLTLRLIADSLKPPSGMMRSKPTTATLELASVISALGEPAPSIRTSRLLVRFGLLVLNAPIRARLLFE
jgi:YhcH/YjgK/YiaL family protein